MKSKHLICILGFLLFFCVKILHAASDSQASNNEQLNREDDVYRHSWSTMLFYGKISRETLSHIGQLRYSITPDSMVTLEIAHEFEYDNFFRKLVRPFVSTVGFGANMTVRHERTTHYIAEFAPYFVFRWKKFPWNHILQTELTLDEGVSYVTHKPFWEVRTTEKATNARNLLHYMAFELGFSLPNHPEWQTIYRIHHRSGAFGSFCPGLVGSTAVGVGLRYRV